MAGTDSISRQDAIDRINKQREHLQPDVYPQDAIGDAAYRICAEFIERLPSAERVGHWIYKDLDNFRKYEVECSECGAKYIGNYDAYDEPEDFNYCPNCGARMEGEEE